MSKIIYVGGIGLGKTAMVQHLLEALAHNPEIGLVVLNTSGNSGLDFMNALPQMAKPLGYSTKGYAEILRKPVLGAGLMAQIRDNYPAFAPIKTRHELDEILNDIEKKQMETRWNDRWPHSLAYEAGINPGTYKVNCLEDIDHVPEKPVFSALTGKRTKYKAAPLENRKQTNKPMSNEKRAKARAKRKRK